MTRPSAQDFGATGVRLRFGDTIALDDVSLRAPSGQVSAVVGGDGAGKTSLLRCLVGAVRPDAGDIDAPGARRIGYLPASSGVYPDLTVAENLAFRATAYGMSAHDAAARAAELTERAGLAGARDRLGGQLSGGMRQKLGVIGALLHRPDLLVLDEPSTGVDPVSRSDLWSLIASAAADGAAVVLATTYLDDAQRATSVLVLDAGRTLAAGSPQDIVAGMPGSVVVTGVAPAGRASQRAWRRGAAWRIWCPPGTTGPGDVVEPDLQDAVTVAALAREVSTQHDTAPEPQPDPAEPDPAEPGTGEPGPRHRGEVLDQARQGQPGQTQPGQAQPGQAQPGQAQPGQGQPGHGQPANGQPANGQPANGQRAHLRPDHGRALAESVGVSCVFGDVTAVREVSIQVRPGETVGLLGANGAGKTTLIRALLGLIRPTTGQILLLGEPPSRQTRRRIGYVPQGLGLYDDLTIEENLEFASAVFGMPRAHAQGHRVHHGAPAGRPVGELPLGIQRRAAFAQALAHEPELLILDEPTSGVDPLGRARLWQTIAAAVQGGAGALVSTHYMEEAGECDRLIIMAEGHVVAAGTAADIIGGAQVTVVETANWPAAFAALDLAGMAVSLAGRTLRVPEASPAKVARILAGTSGASPDESGNADGAAGSGERVYQAPATLEERFFELTLAAGRAQAAA